MKKSIFYVFLMGFILIGSGCKDLRKNQEISDWNKIIRYSKSINNITYSFPSNISEQRRNEYIQECELAIKKNLLIINDSSFNDSISIDFLESRKQMLKYTGMSASGRALADRKAMFVITDESNPPIKHELMHMVSMLKWGHPHETSTWMNEGLATYAAGLCNGYSVEQIYTFLLNNKMLIPIDKLADDFYSNPEMIAYHQSGYLVEHLLKNYELDKFKKLWSAGIDHFESIYSISFPELIAKINTELGDRKVPDIDWNKFKKGCD